MKSLLTLILFLISFAAQAAFFCAKAQSSRFDDRVLQARIEALIKAQIRLEQKDFGSQSEFEMALAYFQNETARLHQAVPGFVHSASFSPDGKYLVTGRKNKVIIVRIQENKTLKRLRSFKLREFFQDQS